MLQGHDCYNVTLNINQNTLEDIFVCNFVEWTLIVIVEGFIQ
jgi:hypothetical protein